MCLSVCLETHGRRGGTIYYSLSPPTRDGIDLLNVCGARTANLYGRNRQWVYLLIDEQLLCSFRMFRSHRIFSFKTSEGPTTLPDLNFVEDVPVTHWVLATGFVLVARTTTVGRQVGCYQLLQWKSSRHYLDTILLPNVRLCNGIAKVGTWLGGWFLHLTGSLVTENHLRRDFRAFMLPSQSIILWMLRPA
jgi:hypothetical protein